MPTAKELREQQARILTNARAKFDEIKDNTPEDRAAEINREFDAMMATSDGLEKQIERMARMDALQSALSAPDPRRPAGNGEGRGTDDGEPVTYREAFREYLQAAGSMSDMRPEARMALQKGFQKTEARAQTTTTNAAGGFTVPVEMQNMLVKSMLAWGPMYDPGVTSEMVTASGNILPIPTVNDTTRAVTTTAEGVTLTDDGSADAVFAQKQLEAYSYNTKWLRVSYELAQDSIFNMESLLADLLGEGLGRGANLQLTTGTGSSAPNGIVTAATLGKTTASATAFTWDEIMDLEHSVDPAYRNSPKCRYMFNDTILLAAKKLKDGQGNYLWQQGDVQGGTPALFNGRQYSINQAMAATQVTTARIMLFGDFSKYYVRKVGAPLIMAMQDKDFAPGYGIFGYIRFDGELLDTAAVKYMRNL